MAQPVVSSEQALRADNPSLEIFFAAVKDTVQACEILRTRFIFTQDDKAPWEAVGLGSSVRIQLKIHHALYDAVSIQAIWRILGENYRKRLGGHDQDGEEPVSHLFRLFARTVALAQRPSVAFWTKLVQDYNCVPLGFPGDSLQASSTFQFTVDEQTLSLLQTRCMELSVTTKAALQLSWVKVLCENLYGQPDVVYGEVVSTSGGFDGDGDDVNVGPTINTVPMRAKLVDQSVSISLAEALTRAQNLSDDARGVTAMGSLREIQTLWRSSSQGKEHIPATLFESLFVFDGIIASTDSKNGSPTPPLFRPAQTQAQGVEGDSPGGPAYDDYPVIVSFHIKDNVLHGKLRAKMIKSEVQALGARLETAVRNVISNDLQKSALDIGLMKVVKNKNVALNGGATNVTVTHSKTDSLEVTARAVSTLVKTVLGTRCEGKDISYSTRLVNVGLDSILAIRLSNLLRKRLGITVQESRQQSPAQDGQLKGLVATRLGLPNDLIQSVIPVLAGQRAHLEQLMYNGKRFFEAPWVYLMIDDSLDAEEVARSWAELCRIHEVLRTTFVWMDNATGLIQVTLNDQWKGKGCFTVLRDMSQPIKTLVDEHVGEENGKPSDLRESPAGLSFLEALDGRAVVLRVHHALYDAWSIKMIEKDFNELLATGRVTQAREPLEHVVRQIRTIRQPDAENAYWKHHLSHAQDTIIQGGGESNGLSASMSQSPLGPHFKASYSAIVPESTMEALFRTKSNFRTSAAIILAYARTLGHLAKCSRPTFGLNHASKSLSSADEPGLSYEEHLLDLVQDHLAHLTKFAQSDGVQRFCPKFNTYINIIYSGDNAAEVEYKGAESTTKVLSRHRLQEPLASNYYCITEPSLSAVSTLEVLRRLTYGLVNYS
ncbi:condensation domain-containing protein [Dactylonectria estremocensis]|uniref:Condensation domain-containing protein n=1 Tax=Dactylonectria estremocensis TaxID=1079267 RepID=A0A9P9EYW4_9HYPO|nr:condensation domain-containing protein [Dactylonectria estremocensis]